LDVFLKYLNAQNLNAFIYVSDLQEEATMDKKSKWKQVQEDLQLIYMTYCREVKEREIVKERNPKSEDRERGPKESSNMGSIPRERVTLLPRMSMGERRKEA
jgi:hypothetical protein